MGKKWKLALSQEVMILALFSLTFTLNTLFFVAKEVDWLNALDFLSVKSSFVIYSLWIISFLIYGVYLFRKPRKMTQWLSTLLLVFLPSICVFLVGFEESKNFNYLFKLAVGLYFFSAGFFCLAKYAKYEKMSDFWRDFRENKAEQNKKSFWNRVPVVNWFISQGRLGAFVLLVVLVLNLGFGVYHLGEFAAVDEALWTHGRITKYWNNVFEREWEKTMVSDKPGITVAIISGAGLLFENPKDYEDIKWEGEVISASKDVRDMNFAFRFPILFFNLLMLLVFYALVKRLWGPVVGILSFVLIGLSPILLGISTIINPDSLLWTFVPLSMLSYFIYLKEQTRKYLYLSGIFLGLSILTKYVSNIIYIFFFGLIFLDYIFNQVKYQKTNFNGYLRKALVDYVILIVFSIATFYLFLPEAWVKIKVLLEGTLFSQAFENVWPIFLGLFSFVLIDAFLLKSFLLRPVMVLFQRFGKMLAAGVITIFAIFMVVTMLNTYFGMIWYDLEALLASPKTSKTAGGFLGLMLANFYSIIFGISPLAFLALFFISIKSIIFPQKEKNLIWVAYLAIFILLYYAASTASGVSATVRYQIVVYPLAFMLASLALAEIFELKKMKQFLPNSVLIIGVVAVSVYSLNFIRPFYFSYASSLLPQQYVLNLKDMGDGSYEAAMYLNKLPNAKNLFIWSDKRGVCTFFLGRCKSSASLKIGEGPFDYFVVSSGRESRTSKLVLSRVNSGSTEQVRLDQLYLMEDSLEYKLEIGGRPNNFVKIIKGDELSD